MALNVRCDTIIKCDIIYCMNDIVKFIRNHIREAIITSFILGQITEVIIVYLILK